MLPINKLPDKKKIILFFILALLPAKILLAQDYRYGVYATPVISWFKTDIEEVKNQGARAGFIFGISAERQLTDNWHFNTGLAFINSSARLKSVNATYFRFPSHTAVVAAGEPVIYRIQYISVPVGIKIKTSEIGYLTYFAEFGLDPKVVVRSRADIPSINIKGENAVNEIRRFNVGYHLDGGVDYSIDENISLILGLGYESNILDITKDNDNQATDRTSQKLLKFIFGINF
jgi:opacity protein-like surface antigen